MLSYLSFDFTFLWFPFVDVSNQPLFARGAPDIIFLIKSVRSGYDNFNVGILVGITDGADGIIVGKNVGLIVGVLVKYHRW